MRIVALYDYVDAESRLLYQVVRFHPKDFRQRRPDPEGKDGWTWNLKGVNRVLYRLPQVVKAIADSQTVYLVEGEKDADNLNALGLTATTNPGGAGMWSKDYTEALRGAHVIILPDNHEAGMQHAEKVEQKLRNAAASVVTVHLPDLSPEGDVSDWIAAGGTRDQLESLVAAARQPRVQGGVGAAVDEDNDEEGETPAQALIAIAAQAGLFHDADGRPYATLPVNEHHETVLIGSRDFKRWIVRQFYVAYGRPPSAKALSEAMAVIEARATFDGPEKPVHIRVAEHAGSIFLDLCSPQREVVEITPNGWRILPGDQAPVKFRRMRSMRPLPRPVKGGRLRDLQTLLGIREERHWRLLVGFLLAALRPRGPYPVLGLHGEQGSGKSTRARIIRSLIDPSSVPLRSEPKSPRDLMIAANNAWCVALDNLSRLPVWLSDALCRLATGGGFGTRELFTNDEEQLFDSMRPVILTGIEAVATRPDLLDRSLLLEVPCIAKEHRKTEQDLYAAVEPLLPGILGALLDAIVCALKSFPKVQLPGLPRMADFAKWVTSAEPALGWKPGSFLEAYTASQDEANDVALDAYPIVDALRKLMANQ
jgi:hypothetical protein